MQMSLAKTNFIARIAIYGGAILFGATLAFAEPKGHNPDLSGPSTNTSKSQSRKTFEGKQRHGRNQQRQMMKELFDSLNLEKSQRENIMVIIHGHQKKMQTWFKDHKKELQALRKEFKDSHKASKNDREAAKKKFESLKAKRKAIFKTRPSMEDHLATIRKVLNKDQQKTFDIKVAEIKKKMEAHKKEMMRKRRSRGRDGKKQGDKQSPENGKQLNP